VFSAPDKPRHPRGIRLGRTHLTRSAGLRPTDHLRSTRGSASGTWRTHIGSASEYRRCTRPSSRCSNTRRRLITCHLPVLGV
jgi:hypothetical protein